MIRKGEEIKNRHGEVLAIANRDLYLNDIRQADDFTLPDGSFPRPNELMPTDLVEALEERGMYPNG